MSDDDSLPPGDEDALRWLLTATSQQLSALARREGVVIHTLAEEYRTVIDRRLAEVAHSRGVTPSVTDNGEGVVQPHDTQAEVTASTEC